MILWQHYWSFMFLIETLIFKDQQLWRYVQALLVVGAGLLIMQSRFNQILPHSIFSRLFQQKDTNSIMAQPNTQYTIKDSLAYSKRLNSPLLSFFYASICWQKLGYRVTVGQVSLGNFFKLYYNLPPQMRIESPNIGWHGLKDRILSIDFHPFTNQFASAGSDDKKFLEEEREGYEGCIKIWQIIQDGRPLLPENKNLRILYGLSQADKNTNVVRYSPNGAFLASGSDDKCITIWQKRENCLSINRSQRIMRWSAKSRLMGHTEDVLDLQWTQSSRFLVSAGMDKRIFVWNVQKKYHVKVLDQHQKFVQGIALDLKFEHIISCSNDRSAKIWKCVKTKRSQTEFYCKKSLKRFDFAKTEDEDNVDQKTGFRIFADESVPTFFRRPAVSPDGELFLFPSGIWHKTPQSKAQYCSFLYRKNFLEKPSFVLPTNGEPALVCKFCPKLFRKKDEKSGLFAQPYYMVYAVATSSAVLIYSTEKAQPLYGMGNYHYAALTDLSWKGSEMLAVASSDGYCSFLIFENNELGEIYEPVGELANLMKVQQWIPSPVGPKVETSMQKQRVQYRQTENGMKKKRIIPKKVSQI